MILSICLCITEYYFAGIQVAILSKIYLIVQYSNSYIKNKTGYYYVPIL